MLKVVKFFSPAPPVGVLSYSSSSVAPTFNYRNSVSITIPTSGEDLFFLLPPEISSAILSYCSLSELLTLTEVCHSWRNFVNNPCFWKTLDFTSPFTISTLSNSSASASLVSLLHILEVVEQPRFSQLKTLKLGRIEFPLPSHPLGAACSTLTNRPIKKRRVGGFVDFQIALSTFGKIMKCFQTLEVLDLSLCHNVSNAVIQQITRSKCSSTIRSLILSSYMTNGNLITDTGLIYIGMYCPSLSTLSIPWCRHLSGIGLSHLNRGCPNLSSVDVTGNRLLTVDAIYHLVSPPQFISDLTDPEEYEGNEVALVEPGRRPEKQTTESKQRESNIRYLNVSGCDKLNDDALFHISQHCKDLEHLFLLGCKKLTDDGLKYIAKSCSSLQTIHIYRSTLISDKGIGSIIERCKYLRSLEVYSCRKITNGVLALLEEKATYLKVVRFYGCERVTTEAIQKLKQIRPNVDIKK